MRDIEARAACVGRNKRSALRHLMGLPTKSGLEIASKRRNKAIAPLLRVTGYGLSLFR
jgi:hypothetical protein